MKILVIQQKMIGDVLMSSIICDALKQHIPDCKVHYLINTHTHPVVAQHPNVDKFIFFSKKEEGNYWQLYRFLKQIKREQYNIVIDVYAKLSSKLITYFSKAKTRISYQKKNHSFFYTATFPRKKVAETPWSLAIENRIHLLELINIKAQHTTPKIYLAASEITNAKQFLTAAGLSFTAPIFMISALGSNADKTYPSSYMAALLDYIVQTVPNVQLLFNYIPSQLTQATTIYDACTSKTKAHIFFKVYGKNLRKFLAITSHCTAIIGNEGGAINMGKALKVPSFCIFSPYISKQNWFWSATDAIDYAVHIADVIDFSKEDKAKSKANPENYYKKLKPKYIIPELSKFLSKISDEV